MVEHNDDVRLCPLDEWERDWIAGALLHAMSAMANSDPHRFRLIDLMRKVRPNVRPPQDEDGKVVQLVSVP